MLIMRTAGVSCWQILISSGFLFLLGQSFSYCFLPGLCHLSKRVNIPLVSILFYMKEWQSQSLLIFPLNLFVFSFSKWKMFRWASLCSHLSFLIVWVSLTVRFTISGQLHWNLSSLDLIGSQFCEVIKPQSLYCSQTPFLFLLVFKVLPVVITIATGEVKKCCWML